MGSRNKVLLASLVSMVMMLSFAIGLVPAAIDNSLTGASAAAPAVAITADGATPAGDSLTLAVGESVSFSALGADAAVDWSLASDGSAELVDAGASATVVARAPGEAGLYLSSASGVDLVNLTIVDGAKQGGAGSITTKSPSEGGTIIVPTGADTVPFTLTAAVATGTGTVTYERVDDPSNPQDVEVLGSSSTPPYAVGVANILDFVRGVGQIDSLYAWIAADHVYTSFNIVESEVDADGNAIPDNPFLLNLGPGDIWVASQSGSSRQVVIVPLVDNFDKQFSLDGDGATASITNPANPDQVVTAFAPAGLIGEGELGYLILVVADNLQDLLDEGGNGTDINAFPGALIAGSRFADVSIIVTDDGGDTFAEIETPLAANVVIQAEGVATSQGGAVRVYSYESEVTQPPVFLNAENGFLWTAIPNTLVGNGVVTASTNNLSVFAPFSTGDALFINSVVNTTSGSALEGSSQARATGGDTLMITVGNVAPGTANTAVITIEGKEVAYSAAVSGETVQYTVAAPQANPLATPAASNAVPVVVTIGADADQATLTYVGPTILAIQPDFGPVGGGTAVVITGSGFTGSTVTIGGSPLIGANVTSVQVTGTTAPGQAGNAEVRAQYAALGYFGTAESGFQYLGAAPTISLNPMSVFSDGGYTIRVTAAENGGRFVEPIGSVENEIYFTQNSGDELGDGADPANDIQSGPVSFIDDRTLDVLSPDITGLGKQLAAVTLYNVYWTTSAYSDTVSKQEDPNAGMVSNFVKDFAFVDPDSAAYRIDTINPSSGPAEGGNSVVITGDFGGLEDPFQEGPPPPREPEGRQTFFGAVFVEGEEIEFAPNEFSAQPGDRFELTLYHSVALDKQVGAAPASLTFAVSWDPAVLAIPNPNPAQGFNPVSRSQLLIDWYNKGLDVNYGQRAQGRLPIVLSGGSTFTPEFTTVSTSITTCNNQLPVIDEDDCSEQQNPFPMVTIIFDVVGSAGSSTSLSLADYAGADRDGNPTGSPQDGLSTTINIGGGKQAGNGDAGLKVTFFNVSFGPLDANVQQSGFLPSDPETDAIEVIAPDARNDSAALAAFGRGEDYTVDVRVEGPDIDTDPTQFAIRRDGYTYEGGPLRQITGITPTSGWVFGSEELTIEGQGFLEGASSEQEVVVTFTLDDILDGQGNPIVLEAAIQGEIEDDAIVVIVPPMVVNGQAIDLATRTTTATVAVDFGDGTEQAEEAGSFTYVKWDVTGTEASGQVTTNAFIFHTAEGFSGDDGFVFDGPAQQKSWTDPLTEIPSATTGILTIPALPPAFKDSTDLVFGILRVTRNGELFGISENPPASDPFPGDEIAGIFNFDLHLYQGEDLAEFYVEYDATEVADPDDLPSIIYNVEDTDLSREMIATGGVSTWSRPTTFDFTYNNRSLTIPPVPGEKDERIPAAMRPSTYALEALLVTEDTAVADENEPVSAVRTRLQNLGAGAFALRSGQLPPRELWEAYLGTTGADRTITTTGGNRELIITGRYIYWSTDLYIVLQGQSPSAANSTEIEDRFRGEDGSDVLVATAPALAEGTYDLYVQLPSGTLKQVEPFLVEGQLIVSDDDPDGPDRPDFGGLLGIIGALFATVLGGMVALLGLLAGGDSSSSGGPCFIATAAYGSPMATEIEVLRTIRDSYLLSNPLGSAFVDVYYRVSPALADVVAQSPVLAAVVRLLLLPVLFAGKMLVSMPIVSIGLLSLSLALASLRRRFSRGM